MPLEALAQQATSQQAKSGQVGGSECRVSPDEHSFGHRIIWPADLIRQGGQEGEEDGQGAWKSGIKEIRGNEAGNDVCGKVSRGGRGSRVVR